MWTDKEFEEHKKWAEAKLAEMEESLNELRNWYRGMSQEELRKRFEMQDNETLRWLCADVGLPAEYYEICQIAKEVLASRQKSL